MKNGMEKLGNIDELFESQKQLKRNNKGLYDIYQGAIIEKNPTVLKEKTLQQIIELKRLFKSKQLRKFQKFVDNFIIIRSDDSGCDSFKAPIHTGNQSGGGTHFMDHMVRAENYVYASFDKITHHMTNWNVKTDYYGQHFKENKFGICEGNIEDKSELIFCDIANVSGAGNYGNGQNKGRLEHYMVNCFDYREGKNLLALYLSIAFDSTEDVIEYFKKNHPRDAQHWHDDSLFTEEKRKLTSEEPGENLRYIKFCKEINRRIDVQKKSRKIIKEIFLKTGIIPPFSLEIRIQDEAEKVDINEIIDERKKTVWSKVMSILNSK